MTKLFSYLKDYKKQLIIGPLFKLLEAILELLIPTLMVYVIDKGFAANDLGYIVKMGILMLGIAAVGLCSALICQYSASIASQGYGTALRDALFQHIGTLSHAELDRLGTTSLVNRITNDVNVLQQSVAMLIRLVIRAPFICIGSLMMAMFLNWKLSLIICLVFPLFIVTIYLIMSRTVPLYQRVQKRLDSIAGILRENLSGVRVIRAFARRDGEEKRFEEANDDFCRRSVTVGRISALLSPITTIIMNFAVLAILWFGGKQIQTEQMTQGEIIAFTNYISYMVAALLVTANLVILFTRAWASAGRIREVFDTVSSLPEPAANTQSEDTEAPLLTFDQVTFRYHPDGDAALDGISFSLNTGETLGIIGGTGSGKSTLVNLIPRFYDVSDGAILWKGQDIRTISLEKLRQNISCVMQKAVLFSGTVGDNIRQGKPDASLEEVEEAAAAAQAAEFIRRLPQGYDTRVERGGNNFSGGQKQRLSIARALVRRPALLILDDSSSALDYGTEAALRRDLKTFTEGMTVILVAQRASTVRHADHILVLDDGKCVGWGTHSQLYETSPVYREICDSQSKEQEAPVC